MENNIKQKNLINNEMNEKGQDVGRLILGIVSGYIIYILLLTQLGFGQTFSFIVGVFIGYAVFAGRS